MENFKKIAEIKAYYEKDVKEVIKTLENTGFVVVDDDENDTTYKLWHVLKKVKN